jgi:CDGSH-type Zn-finger protein
MATVTPTRNGPYKIEGATLQDVDGMPLEARDPMFLCRCGHSENKPFCDGHHSKVDFQG